MSGFLVFAFGVSLLMLTGISLWRRRARLMLTDVFLVGFALFFGAYSLIDISLNDAQFVDTMTVVVTFVQVTMGALIVYAFGMYGPKWVQRQTSLPSLMDSLSETPGLVVVIVITCGLAFRAITTDIVGDLEVQNPELVAQREAELPYWYTVISQFLPMMVFASGLAAAARGISAKGLRRLFWAACTVGSSFFFFGAGRRALFALLLLIFWMFIRHRRQTFSVLIVTVLAIPLLMGASNLYQAYRQIAYRGAIVSTTVRDLDLLEAPLNMDLTMRNLQEREAMWRFNADVIQNDKGSSNLGWGTLFSSSLANYVPAILNPTKEIFDAELELERNFHLTETDRASNVFVSTYGDFGIFALVVAPAMVCTFIFLVAVAMRRLQSSTLRSLLLSSACYYSINTESAYAAPIQIARDFLIVALIFGVLKTTLTLLGPLRRTRPARERFRSPV